MTDRTYGGYIDPNRSVLVPSPVAPRSGDSLTGSSALSVEIEALKSRIRELEAKNAALSAERDARLNLRRREDHPELFEDGDTYLVGLRVNYSRATDKRSATPEGAFWEWAVVTIRCDEDYFEVYEAETQEPWGWVWEDVEVWCRLTPTAALEALQKKMEERKQEAGP